MSVTIELAERLDGLLGTDLKKDGRLGKVRRYLRGEHDDPYTPRGAKAEFRHLAKRAVTNWLPLISDSYSRALFVDGYRVPRGDANVEAWKAWQANALDARQSIVHRGALEYGTSYVLVLPGNGTPVIKCLSPLSTMAWYDEDDDEFPRYVLTRTGKDIGGNDLFDVYDATSRYRFRREDGQTRLYAREDHGMGVTPVVRFRDRLDGECVGLIRPVIPLQDRINETIFATLIAMQYASFRQRWATGMSIPIDEDEDSDTYGEPVETFDAAVNRLWVTDSHEARFGDFAQTDIRGHLELYDGSIRTLAATAQISPNVLTGDLVNISAEALAQMESATQRRLDEYKVLFGEAWEQVFRLVALAGGQPVPDEAAEVRWRDTEARSLTATVEALGLLATQLGVPAEALWEKIPGVSDSELLRWKALVKTDPMDRLTDEIARQTARAGDTLVEAATLSDAPPPAPEQAAA